MRKLTVVIIFFLWVSVSVQAQKGSIFIEAESFQNKGGWVVDQQFTEIMGSSYLMAHGMGIPVANAETTVEFPSTGEYTIFVRTFNWASPWYEGQGPGKFQLMIDGKNTGTVLGDSGSEWFWQNAGKTKITSPKVKLRNCY